MLALFLQYFDNDEDKQLFTDIYNTYRQYLLKTAADKLYDKSNISDCVQDTFLELTYSFDTFKTIEDENKRKSYLVTICKRCAIKINNKADNMNISTEDLTMDEKFRIESRNTIENDIPDLTDIICNMDEKYREPIIMKYAEGYSIEEISEKLGISVTAVKQRLYRGRNHIARLLEQR